MFSDYQYQENKFWKKYVLRFWKKYVLRFWKNMFISGTPKSENTLFPRELFTFFLAQHFRLCTFFLPRHFELCTFDPVDGVSASKAWIPRIRDTLVS